MPPIPLRSIPGVTWPPIPAAQPSQAWCMYRELDRTQWLPPEAIEQGQLTQVRGLLEHCIPQVPYYQELLQNAGIRPADIRTMADFRRIPLLDRQTYQQQFPRFQARSLPEGMVKTTVQNTSGSSGRPIKVWNTNLTELSWEANYLRDMDWCGFDLRARIAVIRAMPPAPQRPPGTLNTFQVNYWHPALQTLIESGPSYYLDLKESPEQQIQWLRQVAPDYLLSYPSNLAVLARLLADSGTRLNGLRAIQTVSETLDDNVRARIETAFGVPVKDSYSCVEAGYLASPCPKNQGYHVHMENVLFEVLDAQGQPVLPGQTGKVVLTPLQNYLTPMIRYEIGDEVVLGQPCPCGRGLPLLQKVLGKRRPMFFLSDERRKHASVLHDLLNQGLPYHQYQTIQRARDHIIIRCVPSKSWTEAHTAAVVQRVREFAEAPIRVDVELVGKLDISANGKLRDFVVEVQEPSA
jgi:phenylacetate-CoA ligase